MCKTTNEYREMQYSEFIALVVSGIKFRYISYDHKKALKEYHSNDKYMERRSYVANPNCHEMPEELQEKYKVERIGKLREIHFAPDGKAFRFRIGNKYTKSFSKNDFGHKVFPITPAERACFCWVTYDMVG
jgi:hypothetical protein